MDNTLVLKNLTEYAGMAYMETGINLRVSEWNQGAEDLFGYSENAALGHFLYDLIPIDKEMLIQCEQWQRQSISHDNLHGKKIQCDITYTPIMNLKAEKLGMSLLAIDLSGRLKGDTGLELQKQDIEEIFSYAPIGIYHVQLDGKITMANSAYAWMLGYESSEAVVTKITNFPTQIFFDQKKAREFMFNIFEADQIIRFRCQLRRKDNSYLWALCYAKTTKNESGRIDGFNGFSIDISATVRTEQALKEANEKLKLL